MATKRTLDSDSELSEHPAVYTVRRWRSSSSMFGLEARFVTSSGMNISRAFQSDSRPYDLDVQFLLMLRTRSSSACRAS